MTEAQAIKVDAERRLIESKAVRAELWGDREDATVMSELTVIQSEINAAEKALAGAQS